MARIMIQLRNDVALDLHETLKSPRAKTRRKKETKQLLALSKTLQARIEPVHPGQRDPLLTPHFMIDVPDDVAADVAKKLSSVPGVEGAYVKPEATPP
ncbi:MAG TPA: hypothetical protein VIB79_06750 [Candidatus Binatia bacterium]